MEFVKNNLFQYVLGSIVLAIILSLFFGLIMYSFMKIIRKKQANIH
jgi:hypothetical protein